jgi:hypothetical protein
MKIKLDDFAEAIATRVWESVGRANWRKFEEARTFVRRLHLKSFAEWLDYCKSSQKPPDIPSNSQTVYRDAGWAGWGDWLGTGTVALRLRKYRSFKKARAFVRSLGLNSGKEWNKYCRSGKKPFDVPTDPHGVYVDAGWASMGDWLGTGTVAPRLRKYRSFKKARAFVRNLGLKWETEWRDYRKSDKKPADIPTHPDSVYAETGWAGMNDWLGTGRVAPGQYRSFTKARVFVRSLSLQSVTQWHEYCNSGRKPTDIPNAPQFVYEETGWAGWGDWLGTGTVAPHLRKYRSFKKARTFVRSLGLKSGAEWAMYRKSGKKPADIPSAANAVYATSGWAGMGDWLGYARKH